MAPDSPALQHGANAESTGLSCPANHGTIVALAAGAATLWIVNGTLERADSVAFPTEDERRAYQGLVWQCRYSGVEVPDELWRHAKFGVGKLYADDQADNMVMEEASMAVFDNWVETFAAHVARKGIVPGTDEAEKGARSTTNV
jgi:hypothetical protein